MTQEEEQRNLSIFHVGLEDEFFESRIVIRAATTTKLYKKEHQHGTSFRKPRL
jgi:hypothetical protein